LDFDLFYAFAGDHLTFQRRRGAFLQVELERRALSDPDLHCVARGFVADRTDRDRVLTGKQSENSELSRRSSHRARPFTRGDVDGGDLGICDREALALDGAFERDRVLCVKWVGLKRRDDGGGDESR
jgi:hypothetical protein